MSQFKNPPPSCQVPSTNRDEAQCSPGSSRPRQPQPAQHLANDPTNNRSLRSRGSSSGFLEINVFLEKTRNFFQKKKKEIPKQPPLLRPQGTDHPPGPPLPRTEAWPWPWPRVRNLRCGLAPRVISGTGLFFQDFSALVCSCGRFLTSWFLLLSCYAPPPSLVFPSLRRRHTRDELQEFPRTLGREGRRTAHRETHTRRRSSRLS